MMQTSRVFKGVKSSVCRVALARNFHAGAPKESSSVLEADSSKQLNKWYHTSGLALAVLTPVAFAVSPSAMNMPVDLALGLIFPFHSHVALNYVITDYVPKSTRSMARAALLAASVIAAAGLLKLNLQGPGLTESIKSLWRAPKEEKGK